MSKRIYLKTVNLTDLNNDNIILETDATPISIILNNDGTAGIYFYLEE